MNGRAHALVRDTVASRADLRAIRGVLKRAHALLRIAAVLVRLEEACGSAMAAFATDAVLHFCLRAFVDGGVTAHADLLGRAHVGRADAVGGRDLLRLGVFAEEALRRAFAVGIPLPPLRRDCMTTLAIAGANHARSS